MNKYEKEQLVNLLTKWFKEVDFDKTNIFNKDCVAKLLKDKLYKLGKWIDRREASDKIKLKENIKTGVEKRKILSDKITEITNILIKVKSLTCPRCGDKLKGENNKLVCSNLFCVNSD